MPQVRTDPYPAFVFQVIVPGISDDPNTPKAMFAEVNGLGLEIDVVEYRTGGDFAIRKLPGLTKTTDVTLKRGIIGDLTFWNWLQTGVQGKLVRADVQIVLLDEQLKPVLRWKLRRAWIRKYEGPALNAKSSDVAIESLTLTHEGLEIE